MSAVRLSPLVRVVLAPNPSPYTLEGTNTYLIGERNPIVMDPGPDDAGHLLHLGVATDCARMHVCQMGEIHQVIHQQLPAGIERVIETAPYPLLVHVPGVTGNQCRIRLGGIAHPDPHERVLLHRGETADAGALEDARLAGDADAGAGAVEDQAVIAALEAFLDDRSHVQRRTTMAAHVVQCRDAVLPVAVEDDRLVADAAGERSPISSAQAATYQALRMSMVVSSSSFFVSGQGSK